MVRLRYRAGPFDNFQNPEAINKQPDHEELDLFAITGFVSKLLTTLFQGCHFPDNMKFPDFLRPRLSPTVSRRPFRGLGACSPRKFSKLGPSTWLKMNFRQQNSLFCRKFSDFLGKFPDFQRYLSNSITFLGFPGQWQPCSSTARLSLL